MAAESPSSVRKVVVQLKATADAPILKQTKFKIDGNDKFVKVVDFLRRQLHRETVFVYINSAFSPNPDELLIDLFNIPSLQARAHYLWMVMKILIAEMKDRKQEFHFHEAFMNALKLVGLLEMPLVAGDAVLHDVSGGWHSLSKKGYCWDGQTSNEQQP